MPALLNVTLVSSDKNINTLFCVTFFSRDMQRKHFSSWFNRVQQSGMSTVSITNRWLAYGWCGDQFSITTGIAVPPSPSFSPTLSQRGGVHRCVNVVAVAPALAGHAAVGPLSRNGSRDGAAPGGRGGSSRGWTRSGGQRRWKPDRRRAVFDTDEARLSRPDVSRVRGHFERQTLRHSGVQRLQRLFQAQRPQKTHLQVAYHYYHQHHHHHHHHHHRHKAPPLSISSGRSVLFLSASLYISKRGAYWDRLCRNVVGRWLVGRWSVVTRVHCGQMVHPRPIVTMEH